VEAGPPGATEATPLVRHTRRTDERGGNEIVIQADNLASAGNLVEFGLATPHLPISVRSDTPPPPGKAGQVSGKNKLRRQIDARGDDLRVIASNVGSPKSQQASERRYSPGSEQMLCINEAPPS
jgi:hypothetical protein